jgi:hypothetical protein
VEWGNRFFSPEGASVQLVKRKTGRPVKFGLVDLIGDAARLIRSGEADIAVCGGTEASIDRVSLGAFAAARALSTSFNDAPEK